jgi:hypothetical protein
MRTSRLSIPEVAVISITVFLFHLTVLPTSLLKLSPGVWSVYRDHADVWDFFFLGIYCIAFIISVGVWFFADAPLSRRLQYFGVLFPVYFLISFVACIIVCHIYSVAAGY